MGYFLPSFFQKRVLRYVLSRLDIIDSRELDLEQLDIRWGKKSTFEFRDVGLQVERLVSLLQLPPFFKLNEARVRFLRLTVPADIYNSGIQVEVTGVRIKGSLKRHDETPQAKAPRSRKLSGKAGLARGVKANRPRETRTRSYDPGGGQDWEGEGNSSQIPITEHLAQSFLETEPPEEKAQLKAAIAKSQRLDQSQISEDGEDEIEEGIGTVLSLPAFVADFLQGIINRFSLTVKDVEVSVSGNPGLGPTSSPNPSQHAEALEVKIVAERVEVHEVKAGAGDGVQSSADHSTRDIEGRRKVSIKGIYGSLITDETLFSVFSQPSGANSPVFTQSSTGQKHGDGPRDSSTPKASSLSSGDGEGFDNMSRSTVIEDMRSSASSLSSSGLDAALDEPANSQDSRGDLALSRGSLLTAQSEDFYSSDSRYEDSVTSSQTVRSCYDDSLHAELYHSGRPESPERLESERESAIRGRSGPEHHPQERRAPLSQGSQTRNIELDSQWSQESPEAYSATSSLSSLPARSFHTSPPEDLTQSRLFSHEEAESMYMSATSNTLDQKEEDALVPGGWIADDSDEEHTNVKNSSPHQSVPAPPSSSHFVPKAPPMEVEPSKEPPIPFASRSNDISAKVPRNDEAPSRHSPDSQASDGKASSGSPQGSRLQKTFLCIHAINVYLPASLSSNVEESHEGPTQGTTAVRDQPGAVPGMFVSTATLSQSVVSQSPDQPLLRKSQATTTSKSLRLIHLVFKDVKVFSDMALIRMAAMALEYSPDTSSKPEKHPKTQEEDPEAKPLPFELTVNAFDFEFFDGLHAVTVLRSETLEQSKAMQPPPGALLRLEMIDSHIATRQQASDTKTTASFGRVVFGYPDQPILSFDSALRMRESVNDKLEPAGHDMTLTILKRSRHPPEVTLMALPIRFTLDLARVDETLSWFGGLSSVLGIGNSVMSTMTVTDTKKTLAHAQKAKRGVHFEAETAPPNQPKFTARIGGITVDIRGKECSVSCESSALKFVSRVEGIGVRIDKLRFRGPILLASSEAPAIMTQVEDIRLEYLSTPKEEDLSRLLALLSPSRDPQEPDEDILLDTLLRQRRQGGLVRLNVARVRGGLARMEELQHFEALSEELKKLATVAKYLPEDDRPGILTLALIQDCQVNVELNGGLGPIAISAQNIELGHVTIPSLTLLSIDRVQIKHRENELIGPAVLYKESESPKTPRSLSLPTIMLRLIGDEVEPTLKVKIWNLRVEYYVTTLMELAGIKDVSSSAILATELADSATTILLPKPSPKQLSRASSQSSRASESLPAKIDVSIKDSLVGLNPRGSPAKGFVLLTRANVSADLPKAIDSEMNARLDVQKMALLIIDNVANVVAANTSRNSSGVSGQDTKIDPSRYLWSAGYVTVGEISSASIVANAVHSKKEGKQLIEVEVRDNLLVLETCADSTQTLQAIMNGLSPPTPPSKELKYRTEVVPIQDMLASFTGDAFETDVQEEDDTDYSESRHLTDEDMVEDEVPQNLDFVSSFYDPDPESTAQSAENSMLESDLSSLAGPPETREIGDKPTLTSFHEQYEVDPGGESLRFEDNHFGNNSTVGGTAHRWNSDRNTYDVANEPKLRASPLRVKIRDVNFIWNLFDGYDWQSTRDTISNAVADVESRAEQRMAARRDKRRSLDMDEEEDSVIGDFLFNSIYIGVPANADPRDLARQVNRNLDDLASETESHTTTTTASPSPSRQGMSKPRKKRLRLQRSKHHKMTFELRGLSADFIAFPPESGETQSSIDIRVQDLEIFDHVPTSTWKKFATYMHDVGERESGTSMVHIEMVNVKPVPDLAASEIILKVTVLPLRLHVDQDALDFMTRFFEFRDPAAAAAAAPTPRSEAPFLQRVEVLAVQVRLDFKPKRVDYAGLRSGRTTEFMNFFVLDGADLVLRHVIIYGVSGFDRLGRTLNDIWSPDVRRHQLPGVLAGLAAVRPLVNVGAGVRDLVAVPVREYRKDGRVVRAIQKGAVAFAKQTTTELARLGAKLAVGTQTVLQNAEGLLSPTGERADPVVDLGDGSGEPPEEKTVISPYADQPVGVVQGLRGAYRHLERDLLLAKDAIVAMPGEVMESNTAGEAAKAVLRGAPTVVLRPALGVTKAVGQTLLGATNTLDKGERRRVEDKYKRR